MKNQIFSEEKENYQARAEKLFQNSSVHHNCAQSVLMIFPISAVSAPEGMPGNQTKKFAGYHLKRMT